MRKRARVATCLCGKPVALHFDARARKLDCARVASKTETLTRARADVAKLLRYIAHIERMA
jgi:hypothetical protein